MTKRLRKILALALSFALAFSLAACSANSAGDDHSDSSDPEVSSSSNSEVNYKIGVAVYSQSDPEMNMYFNYYRDYISASFPVEFIMSEALDTVDSEISFIEKMKKEGAGAIIGFYNLDIQSIIAACEENEIYYVVACSSMTSEDFDAVKDNPWFLGSIGPGDEEEFNSGRQMAEDFIAQGANSFLIASGGASMGNSMHSLRAQGMLTALQEKFGLTYNDSIESLAEVTEVTEAASKDGVTVVITPGYVQLEVGNANMMEALSRQSYDAFMCVQGVSDIVDQLEANISSSTPLMRIGCVDCFSQQNYDAFEQIAANGYPMIHYVTGKFASMAAPAFVAAFNAMSGYVMDIENGAFRLNQTHWTAASEAEYAELFGYTQSIYENAYSSTDLMQLLVIYNEDASYDDFVELTESTSIENVKARLGVE